MPRLAASALHGVEKRRLLAADKSARADADFQIKAEVGSKNILTEQSCFPRLVNGMAQAFKMCIRDRYLLAKNLSAKSPFAVFQAAQHLSDDVAKQPHRKEGVRQIVV